MTTIYGERGDIERPDRARETLGDNRLLAAICSAALVGFLLASALSPFFPLIAADLGTTVALLGQIPALSMLVAAVLGLLVGPLADHYGHRRLFLIGSVVVIGSAAGTAVAPTFATLLLATLLAAISRAIIQPVALAIAGSNFADAAQRRAMSWVVAAIAGAPIAGVPALTAIGGAWGWRAAFVALAIAALAALALVARVVPTDQAAAQAAPSPRRILASYPPLLRHAPTMSLVGSSFLRSCAAWGWFTYYSAYLVQARDLTITEAGWAYTGVGLGLFVGSILAGGRIARLPTVPLLVATALLQGALLCLPIVLALGVPVVLAAMSLGALTMGISNVTVSLALVRESPGGRATTMTVNQAALSAGSAVGSAVGGALLAFSGYAAIAASVPAFCLAAALALWWGRARSVPVAAAARS